MNLDQYTQLAAQTIQEAAKQAMNAENPSLTPIHLFNACLQQSFVRSLLSALGASLPQLEQITMSELARLPQAKGSSLTLDQSTAALLQHAKQEADRLSDVYVSLEHILLAFVSHAQVPSTLTNAFKSMNLTPSVVLSHIQTIRKGKTVVDKNAENSYQLLEKYCIDITQLARQGKLDPVIGRHEEIRRVIQILSRRTKNNPVLIGEPGVGKTAIVEGIAQRIINNDVPESLQRKKIFSLDLGLLIAGAKYQGEFEDRLKGVLKEIESSSDAVILFIDELHMLIGAGGTGGAMDASNLLKPALARGTLHCIGATTIKEYKKYIEKDAAFERRFQQVVVEEPSVEDAISILRGLKERYELHHGIRITDQALVDAAQLSSKYISDRFLPDKAIDVIDEAAAMIKMSIDSQPEELDKIDRTIRQLEIEKVALSKEKEVPASAKRLQELDKELSTYKEQQSRLRSQWKAEKAPLEKINKIKEEIEKASIRFQEAEREGNYAKASEIKYGVLAQLERDLITQQDALKQLSTNLLKQYVDVEDVAAVISRWTGIPVEKLKSKETEKLLSMATALQNKVVGQPEAVEAVSQTIQMHRAGLTDPNKPIGSFLFLGPTGVGKTEVAKALADFLFNDEKRIIRIDMSEYMEKHTVARLIGAPPGYVGFEEGGQLTEQVRRHPYSVVLFDEIEKAHPDVFNIFLQILDEGHLTDSQGRTVSFKNCIIIMTSNIGSEIILQASAVDQQVKDGITNLLYKAFKPEFLNRIDSIIFFNKLTQEMVVSIAKIQLEQLRKRLAQRGIALEVDAAVYELLAQEGFSNEFGARPLKRTIQQRIIVPLSHVVLKKPDTTNVRVVASGNSIEVI